MRLMKHVDQRAGIFRVRMVIPPAARHAFSDLPKSGDFAVSLGTRNEAEGKVFGCQIADAKGLPIYGRIFGQAHDVVVGSAQFAV